ncbi:hypothetical protein TNCV_2854041 [Trichonephila clavipes]|uniref:Transposase n=1 Tax=Trichonephila clavipes TaxID=2585209 RepID=A0A8X6R6N7_TRICX|nr:hypothetical protein TNCV_2854041 [Trichonephila clavipes]
MACLLSRLNPIEYAWGEFGRCVAQSTIPSRVVQEFKTAFRDEWDNIPQRRLYSLVKSMENRSKMCVGVRSQHTSY